MPIELFVAGTRILRSDFPIIQSLDQARKHPGDFLQPRLEFAVILHRQQLASQTQFQERNAVLDRTTGDAKEVLAVGSRESAVALGDVRGNRQCGSVELVDEKAVAARKLLCLLTNLIGEIDRLLVDDELFESERHEPSPRFRESKGERRRKRGG